MSKLVGTIKSINKTIKTRFFYVDENGQRDVTLEVCEAIEEYNEKARDLIKQGEYSLIIPIEYKKGLADYSFGCGLTHYLQESEFENLSPYVKSFPLDKCKLHVFTPSDVKDILKSNDSNHQLGSKVWEYYYQPVN